MTTAVAESTAMSMVANLTVTSCRFATPMRTPRAATSRGEDRLVTEAQNLARLQQGQTPLFGGDSGVHIEKGDFGDSLDPRAGQSVRATPSALAGQTPALGQTSVRAIGGVSSTPSVAGTPLRTPGGSCLYEQYNTGQNLLA